ncbi:uncharacterized protein LOC124804862 isoform X3 [Schistocerca piceifrons]|uniref:uncharacterized protein LOC124804862 isoform X3 n=1 Tax=Schistocerca piceifrons TaxID=274613 RepID=UPI001F5FDF37|nr:uncharacterized protein LOC124804862 isoform X3 [Schistocerca piceifrons]
MKVPQQNPEPPQPLVTLPRELRLVQVGDGELVPWDHTSQSYLVMERREAPDGDRRQVVRARSVRRRLFGDDESAGQDGGAGGIGDAGRRRRRARWPDDPLAVYVLRPAQDVADKMAAEETAAATRRWNFDFVNERPLEGQWQWEKVGDEADGAEAENGGPREAESVDECHSPQR